MSADPLSSSDNLNARTSPQGRLVSLGPMLEKGLKIRLALGEASIYVQLVARDCHLFLSKIPEARVTNIAITINIGVRMKTAISKGTFLGYRVIITAFYMVF